MLLTLKITREKTKELMTKPNQLPRTSNTLRPQRKKPIKKTKNPRKLKHQLKILLMESPRLLSNPPLVKPRRLPIN